MVVGYGYERVKSKMKMSFQKAVLMKRDEAAGCWHQSCDYLPCRITNQVNLNNTLYKSNRRPIALATQQRRRNRHNNIDSLKTMSALKGSSPSFLPSSKPSTPTTTPSTNYPTTNDPNSPKQTLTDAEIEDAIQRSNAEGHCSFRHNG